MVSKHLVSGCAPKLSVIVRIATRDILATGEQILRGNAQDEPCYILCIEPVGTKYSLFFGFPFSKGIWRWLI